VIIIDEQFIDAIHSTRRSNADATPDDGEAPVIVSLVEAAMQMFSAAIDALPDTSDPEFSGRANVILRAGDGFLIPPRTPHNARDLGPETGRMLSTYIVETGQPLSTFVDQHAQR